MNQLNYGFKFTEISIKNNLFIKRAKNEEGAIKIRNETQFYLALKEKNINLCMPALIYYDANEIHIEYIANAVNLTEVINKDNWKFYVDLIFQKLNNIHYISIDKPVAEILNDIDIETSDKLMKRYNETNWLAVAKEKHLDMNKINYVNNVKIKNIEHYSSQINRKIKEIIISQKLNKYNLIHGDTHLGNILSANNNLYFIDPRGYFGNTKKYGLKQYDYAKLLFGISGYSIFDTMQIDELIIENENIRIDFIKKYEYIFAEDYFDELTILFALSIWLGNNSCFLDINKKITSLMIAYYYCEKYLIRLNNYI